MSDNFEFDPQVASNGSNLTINYFDKALSAGTLILRPAFQRNLVWNDEQQGFLVDSILRGLPVPEVYVQTITSAEGSEVLTVVDGQQRISACLRFIHGDLRLQMNDDLDARWRGRTFAEIGSALQKRFRGFKLIVRDLPDLPERTLREIFRRLNKTVEPLEAQELRHAAYTGSFIVFIEALAAQPLLTEVGVFSARDYLRRRNDEFMAEVAFAVLSRAFPNKKEGLDNLFKTMDLRGVPEGQLEDLQWRFGRVLAQLEPVASSLRRTRFRNKSDFYSLVVYLAREADRLPLSDPESTRLLDRIKEFSGLVGEIKKEEAEGRSVDELSGAGLGLSALPYLRAVERAASDRLNRVRRQEALSTILGPILAEGSVRPFGREDFLWLESSNPDALLEDDDQISDKEIAESTLLEPNEAS
ncbi:DUF262 domain-containing protein [Rathayibacter festucae]|uniref:DUF262 domain-containing protein n=1 Tax=Rathayibacter festucae TaxID=110937 RepID=UPI002A6B7505|nr:DUF262 domain-containing protein [Rathayibacter festucae]MDY0912915.1 DUF262 domain-containing protein [Rathayibacter festucae]